MSFIVSAVLLAKVCSTDVGCKVFKIAEFGMGNAGQMFCQGTAESINQTADDAGTESTYFCVAPGAAPALLRDRHTGGKG